MHDNTHTELSYQKIRSRSHMHSANCHDPVSYHSMACTELKLLHVLSKDINTVLTPRSKGLFLQRERELATLICDKNQNFQRFQQQLA